MTKYAKIVNGVVDVISFDPDRVWVEPVFGEPDEETGERPLVSPGHWGEITSEWVAVADTVFGGYVKQADGTFVAPAPDPTPPASYQIGKSTPWRRMTDAEAILVKAAMANVSVRQQEIYNAAAYISTADDLFGELKTLLSTVLTPVRADELLAPEEL